jgi:hypothetical protein
MLRCYVKFINSFQMNYMSKLIISILAFGFVHSAFSFYINQPISQPLPR